MQPPEPKLTEIAIILDRSGSMEAIANDAIGGFNAFISSQAKLQDDAEMARCSLILFNYGYEVPYKSIPVHQIPKLDRSTYIPGGGTALYDAIGRTIQKMTESFARRLPKARPENIIVAILTDGEENSSKDYTQKHIKDLIREKTLQGWEFLFLAANQDAFAAGGNIGIHKSKIDNFNATAEGTSAAFSLMEEKVRKGRGK
jgi:uncharacterized protein with von Willebrand factor type A (vWA) domain